jgi:hypothetical protein
MTDRAKALDAPALRFGAVVALAAAAVGVLASLAHNLVFYDAGAGADEGAANIFAEGLIFLGVLLGGLPAATFLAVWRGRARGAYAITQGAAATVLCCALGLGVGGGVLALLPGGSAAVFGLLLMLSPVYLGLQALAAIAAWVGAGIARRAGRRDPDATF